MSQITKSQINDIRNSVDIVDVITSYLPLSKRGKNYFGVCPFHDDSNPSMSVSREKQIYTCFSCGATGNVFNFLMDYEHIGFYEALKKVADISGIHISIDSPKPKYNNDLYSIYETAQKYYTNNINSGEGINAIKYLKNRQINDDIIKEFGIGLSINKFNLLTKLLISKKYIKEDIIKSGLVNQGDNGLNDVFYNRIMFPITDLSGKVVGYSGRIYNGETHSKYINTKETPIFKKGELLYNYHRAKEICRTEKSVIILEGFMDVIRLHTIGIKNTLATMGTAVTKNQAILIKKLSSNVILCFDGDNAGKKATLACSEELLKIGIAPKIIVLEDNLDPDEYIKLKGKEKFVEKLENPINIMDFKISYFKDGKNLKDDVDMSKYVHDILAELAKLTDDILIELTLKKLSDESNVSLNTLKKELENLKTKETPQVEIFKEELPKNKVNKYILAEKYLLYYMLRSNDVIKIYRRKVDFLPTYECRLLAIEISMFFEKYKYFDIADFLTELNDNPKMTKLLGEILSLDLKEDHSDEEIEDYILTINEYNKKQEYNRLLDNLKNETNTEERIKIAEQIRHLKMEE